MDYGDYYWGLYRDYYSLFAEYPRPAKVKRFHYGRIIQTPKGYRLPAQLLSASVGLKVLTRTLSLGRHGLMRSV